MPDVSPTSSQAIFFKNLTGGIQVKDKQTLILSESPSSDWIGLYVGIANSAYPQNNHYFQVTSIDASTNEITVTPANLKADDGLDKLPDGTVIDKRTIFATLTPYKLVSKATSETDSDGNPIVAVGFEPIISDVSEVSTDMIPSDEHIDQYVVLDFQQPISF